MVKLYSLIIICLVTTRFNAQNQSISKLDCAEFYQELILNEYAQLLDIRQVSLYEKSRIHNALPAETKEKLLSYLTHIKKEDPIFIYCKKGIRSKQCAIWLQSKGYNKIIELNKGFDHWAKQGFPVDSSYVNIKIIEENGEQ
jgi:rhodanese-related sulfurtransferase